MSFPRGATQGERRNDDDEEKEYDGENCAGE